MALTPKQQRFVEEYLVDLNATQAAIRAGYAPNAANEQAARLLANASISTAVCAAQAKRSERVGIEADRVVKEFISLAIYDPADIASQPMTGPLDIPKLPEHVRRAIVGWGWDKSGNFTLKLADKKGALDSLARHLGMFVDKSEVKITGELASRLEAARARRAT